MPCQLFGKATKVGQPRSHGRPDDMIGDQWSSMAFPPPEGVLNILPMKDDHSGWSGRNTCPAWLSPNFSALMFQQMPSDLPSHCLCVDQPVAGPAHPRFAFGLANDVVPLVPQDPPGRIDSNQVSFAMSYVSSLHCQWRCLLCFLRTNRTLGDPVTAKLHQRWEFVMSSNSNAAMKS